MALSENGERRHVPPIEERFKRPQYIGWGTDREGNRQEFSASVLGVCFGVNPDKSPNTDLQRYYMRPGANPQVEHLGVMVMGDTGAEICVEARRVALETPIEIHSRDDKKTHLLWNQVEIVPPNDNSIWHELMQNIPAVVQQHIVHAA